jgi:hypothetical protein
VAQHQGLCELLTLEDLAKALGVHIRTLQAAARTGRLEVEFGVRSVFGRPLRRVSRAVTRAVETGNGVGTQTRAPSSDAQSKTRERESRGL